MDFEHARLISRILSLYYEAEYNQAEIARMLGLSTPKVNRLLQQARREGMVEVRLHVPFQSVFDLERRLVKLTGLAEAVVVPDQGRSEEAVLRAAGAAAASFLLGRLRDGDVLCMGGGSALFELVEALAPQRRYEVLVVPALGGVQGRFTTDVNRLTSEAALRLGGTALQMHAPAIVDSREEHQALCSLRQIRDVLEAARRATVVALGIGTLDPMASYFHFAGMNPEGFESYLQGKCAVGEVLAHIIDAQGHPCLDEQAPHVVGLELDEMRAAPVRIGVAVSARKAAAIAAALRAGYLTTLVTDEEAAKEVIAILEAG